MPQESLVQRDFSLGMVMDTGPSAIDPRAIRDHINGLYEEDASLYKRGGSVAHSTALASPGSNPVVWGFDGHFDAGRRTVFASQSDFYVLDADDETPVNLGSDGLTVPKPSALIESLLFIGGGYIYGGSRKTANYTTGTVTVANGSKTVTGSGTSFTANVDAGMLFHRGNERVYVVASVDSNTQLTLRDAYEGTGGSGFAYTATPLYKITGTDPYEDGEFYVTVANRLVTASGSVLKFTEILKPHKWTLTAGDPPEEIPNEHKFAEGGRILGAGVIGQTTIVFTTSGMWTVDGLAFDIVDSQGNTNHRVQVLSRELICYGQVATWEQALVVPCTSGIFLIDGASAPRRISHPVEQLYQTYIARGYQPGQPAIYRDHLILPIITLGAEIQDVLVARLDRPVRISGQAAFPWSRQGGDGVECPTFFVRHQSSPQEPLLLGANSALAQIVDCSRWWEPSDDNTEDADGAVHEWVLVTRDYETGDLTENMVRTIRPRYELIGDDAEITAEYGFGVSEVGGYTWNDFDWADDVDEEIEDLFWDEGEQDFYEALECNFGESVGTEPEHCRVNESARFIRYRFRNITPCSRLRFRSLEQFIRPSRAVRR